MPLHCSTRLQRTIVVPTIGNPESALRPLTNEPSFSAAVEEMQKNRSQPWWEAVFNQEAAFVPVAVPQAQGKDVGETRRMDVEECLEERRIDDEAMDSVEQLVTEELATLVEESLYEIFRM